MTTTQASIIIEKLNEITSTSAINTTRILEITIQMKNIVTLFIIFGFTLLLFKYILNIRIL